MNDHWSRLERSGKKRKLSPEKENLAGKQKVLNLRKEQNCVRSERREHQLGAADAEGTVFSFIRRLLPSNSILSFRYYTLTNSTSFSPKCVSDIFDL